MRTSKRKAVDVYSPDDRDKQGFLNLVSKWVEEDGLAYNRKDIEEFCESWSNYTNVNLRSKRQWLNELYQFINSDVRYR